MVYVEVMARDHYKAFILRRPEVNKKYRFDFLYTVHHIAMCW